MLLNAIRNPWVQLVTHLVILSVAIVMVARGSVGGYILILASLILLGSDLFLYRQRRAQRAVAGQEHTPKAGS